MTKFKLKWFYITFVLLSLVGLDFASDQEFLEVFDTSRGMVTFNPYVSVRDQYDKSRYGPSDLIPLIEKVATRFNKVHIRLSPPHPYWGDQNSLEIAPFAVALYNCLASTKEKMQVFLELDDSEVFYDFSFIVSIADRANRACYGTVVSIIKEVSPYRANIHSDEFKKYLNQNSTFRYLFGFSMSEYYYCVFVSNFPNVNIDVLLLRSYQDEDILSRTQNLSCEPYNLTKNMKTSVKLITSLAVSYEGSQKRDVGSNMTRLMTSWRHFLTLPSDMYLISLAFDLYLGYNQYWSTGWWYLLKDLGNANTSGYIFEEKIAVVDKVDFEENPKNFKWLEQEHSFDENTTGIVTLHYYPSSAMQFKLFCRLIYLDELLTTFDFVDKHNRAGYRQTCFNFKVYHMPILDLECRSLMDDIEEYLSDKYRTSGPINISVYTLGDNLNTKYGYAYPLEFCAKYKNSSEDSHRFSYKMSDPDADLIVFYFYESEDSVRLKATTLVRHRMALFETCKRLVQTERKTTVEIDFVSLGYFKVEEFSVSPIALQNYVKYTYLLESWVKNQTNTVVFLGHFTDEAISLREGYRDQNSVVGWTSYYSSTDFFISKREEALKLSMFHYPKPVYNITTIIINTTVFARDNVTTSYVDGLLTGNQVFLIVGISFVVGVFIISLVTLLIYQYYKTDGITNDELNIFFNGDNQSENGAHKIPYDKEKYEISEKDFKTELGVPLGAGEFGAVYRGTIDQSSGSLQVAVKTLNPQKFHKTQITGLLSEIKVLAYIGKHANITELLGANTSSLKKGKVYIFLEFCHLGSLQKYLQEMRLLFSSPIQETNVVAPGYVNSCAAGAKVLDTALSNDLYRWSTEICNGMSFLAEKHVVHADLATRNVLLNLRREAKICDFGLSRRMYNYTNYVKTQQEPLPWKWMAPESLKDSIFNEKTDVWAFGVTLWEIYSLAQNPYAGLSWDINFPQMLERGLRLSEPEYCERQMFERMQKCWSNRPDNRPKFSELLLMIQPSDNTEANE